MTPLSYSLKFLLVCAVVKDYVSRAFLHMPTCELVHAEVLLAPNDVTDWVFMLNKLDETMIEFVSHSKEVVSDNFQEDELNPCSYTDREQEAFTSEHVDNGCLKDIDQATSAFPHEPGSLIHLKVKKLIVNGDELKYLGRGSTRTPIGFELRVRPKIMKKLMDLVPDDKKTSPIPGVKMEKKVEVEIKLDAKLATRFWSVNGLGMFVEPTQEESTAVATLEPTQEEFTIEALVDSNWSRCSARGKSMLGGQLSVIGAKIMQFMKVRGVPPLSSPEAKFNALVHVGIEAKDSQTFFKEPSGRPVPISLERDNSSHLNDMEHKCFGRTRHTKPEVPRIKEMAARKANTMDISEKHFFGFDMTKPVHAHEGYLADKREDGDMSDATSENGRRSISKAMETVELMARCLAGIGVLLSIGRTEAVGAADGDTCEKKMELMVVESEKTNDPFLGRWLFYAVMGIAVVLMVYIFKMIFSFGVKDIGKMDASSQTDFRELDGVYTFEVATQYLVGDACKDWRTHNELQDGYFKVFYAMTIQNAREYLAAHRFRSSERTKLGVTEDCVDLRMREVRGGQFTERLQGIFDGIKAADRK